jgi:2-C-methyl-D-erythritol 4-phosphate cytidylyltransferase/2-C-methyl-D-erythritol 2,4-cyclodiphosphate synthase
LTERIIVHDAARPFASRRLFTSVLEALDGWDGVVPLVPITDTLKRTREEAVVGTEPRDGLALAQTPQAFRGPALLEAYRRASEAARGFSDDAGCLEWAGFRVRAVPGEPGNRKITTIDDLRDAEVGSGDARG